MRNVPVKLDAYEITEERYRELMFFCLQYRQKRRQAAALADGRGLGMLYAAGSGGGGHGDPTLWAVQRREKLLRDCEDIEQAAVEAAGAEGTVMAECLLSYVTRREKPPVDMLPCGRRQFYELRRRFFVALHVRREKMGFSRDDVP